MKNIHILPTDKPSRLAKFVNKLLLDSKLETVNRFQHIYITSDGKFNIDEWVTDGVEIIKATPKLINAQGFVNRRDWKKIILTTDQDLIKDGVQSINDEFLEWFVKNPSCDFVEIDKKQLDSHFEFFEYKIIISKEEPTMVDKLKEYFKNTPKERVQKDWEESCKATEGINSLTVDELIEAQKSFNKQKTLEEAAEKIAMDKLKNKWRHLYTFGYPQRPFPTNYENDLNNIKIGLYEGAKWQAERSYSEEEAKLNEKEFYEYMAKQDSWKSTGLIIQEFIQLKLREQDKNKYSEEEVFKIVATILHTPELKEGSWGDIAEWFEQFKKK